MTQTLKQFCNNHRLTAKKLLKLFESVGLHVTEQTANSWISGKTKPNKQYWALIYKATNGDVDIDGQPSVKSSDAVLLDFVKEILRNQLRIEKKMDKILERIA